MYNVQIYNIPLLGHLQENSDIWLVILVSVPAPTRSLSEGSKTSHKASSSPLKVSGRPKIQLLIFVWFLFQAPSPSSHL